ncbi:MAG TPA: transcriptional repressor [Clostridiales bacterium]|nr:transcriptional repressor [Clostridiales bacterium]
MGREKTYRTRQREDILRFFESRPGQMFSAGDLIASRELKVGKATVYRSLSRLTQEGRLSRFIPGPGSAALYQYNREKPGDAHRCRLACVKCGGTEDMYCSFMGEIERHMKGDHGFLVDKEKTVIYGLCKSCK